jgi:hypothetical protein
VLILEGSQSWKIFKDHLSLLFLQNCLGSIDGTHIPISMSPNQVAPFRNRKGTFSQNVVVVCDFDLKISYVSAGWEGMAIDSMVLRSAMGNPVGKFEVPDGKFYLVDGGYANTTSFLAPYRGVRYHLKEFGHGHRRPQNHRELFNHRHVVLRNNVERTLGVIKMRFPILKVATFHKMENQAKIPLAAATLHNLIRSLNGDEKWIENDQRNINLQNFVNVPDGDQGNDEGNVEGNNLRDAIAYHMWSDYQQHRN